MTGTVVALDNARLPDRRRQDTIDMLRRLLERAEAGEFVASAFLALMPNGSRFTSWDVPAEYGHAMVGVLAMTQHEMMVSMSGEAEQL